jgi:hypothetical protein
MSVKVDENIDNILAAVSGIPGSKRAKDCNDVPKF